MDADAVFKALADPSRRELLDRLHASPGQTLTELCAGLDMSRQAVTKHLAILEDANLVAPVKRGREKRHDLNPAPINAVAQRWIGKFARPRPGSRRPDLPTPDKRSGRPSIELRACARGSVGASNRPLTRRRDA